MVDEMWLNRAGYLDSEPWSFYIMGGLGSNFAHLIQLVESTFGRS